MGSPLSPVVAYFNMEKFEETATASALLRPKYWLRYVDNTFVVWSHGEDELERFLSQINNVHPWIQFMIEMDGGQQLLFLNILVLHRADGSLGHKDYKKPTHTDRYLHKLLNTHPRQK